MVIRKSLKLFLFYYLFVDDSYITLIAQKISKEES